MNLCVVTYLFSYSLFILFTPVKSYYENGGDLLYRLLNSRQNENILGGNEAYNEDDDTYNAPQMAPQFQEIFDKPSRQLGQLILNKILIPISSRNFAMARVPRPQSRRRQLKQFCFFITDKSEVLWCPGALAKIGKFLREKPTFFGILKVLFDSFIAAPLNFLLGLPVCD
ncbi:uncharacterized protein LOC123007864 isoform X2 [Tribolium madens]|uniref:uncharacterized protein LOC123007864 isoform X2 n=1 Tax=Tribolium madens TaxID=41895 RepID=UPI001CF74575|nr:uncharacterized protein LOC123007864 isoform X2 [Tribolium madens]